MRRRGENGFDRPVLDDLAVLHHADAVGDPAHDAEVMRDEQHRHAEPPLQLLEQPQYLRLHGDVERGGGLVGDQKVGLVGERHGDHHALALATGQLVRIAGEAAFRIRNADLAQEFDDARARRGSLEVLVQPQHLDNLLPDRVQRIERGHRLLEDDGDVVAAHLADVALARGQQFLALEGDRAGRVARRRIGQQPQDRQRRHRLAGARFADQRHRLAGRDIERHTVDRERLAPVLAERDREVTDGKERSGCHFTPRSKV